MTCSFRFSPVPTPSVNRSGSRDAVVAAACATIAGWMRIVGHVTAVMTGICSVVDGDAAEHAPHEGALPLLVESTGGSGPRS